MHGIKTCRGPIRRIKRLQHDIVKIGCLFKIYAVVALFHRFYF
ncbi:MAG: hypothetical protein ABIK20_02785 [Candidatus Omnitrophota bacterium]